MLNRCSGYFDQPGRGKRSPKEQRALFGKPPVVYQLVGPDGEVHHETRDLSEADWLLKDLQQTRRLEIAEGVEPWRLTARFSLRVREYGDPCPAET